MADNQKYTDNFKAAILKMLTAAAEGDPLFAKSFTKSTKNIDDCCNYILNTVQKSGVQGFTDDEVYGMAMHYYDEDDISDIKPIQCQVVVNHTVQLSEEEIEEAKQKAREDVFAKTAQKLKEKPKVVEKKPVEHQISLF